MTSPPTESISTPTGREHVRVALQGVLIFSKTAFERAERRVCDCRPSGRCCRVKTTVDISKVGVIRLTGSLTTAPFRCTGASKAIWLVLLPAQGTSVRGRNFSQNSCFKKKLRILLAETCAQEGPP